MSFGLPPPPMDCTHVAGWVIETVAGMGIRYCTGCGSAAVLWEREDGHYCWSRIEENPDVSENVPPLRPNKRQRAVQSRPKPPRRPRRSVQAVPGDLHGEVPATLPERGASPDVA
jgi:hypothetical protein